MTRWTPPACPACAAPQPWHTNTSGACVRCGHRLTAHLDGQHCPCSEPTATDGTDRFCTNPEKGKAA